MKVDQHRRSKELFLELCRLPLVEQQERLSNLDEPSEVISEVMSLLEFFEEPKADELNPTPPPHPSTDSSGSLFASGTILAERYRIVRYLAHGGTGSILEAEDLTLGTRVALKFLRATTKSKQLLNDELRLAREVTHPNVCRVYDLGEVDGAPFISMEYVDGEDLQSLLTRIGRLPQDRAVLLARQLFSGLAAAHAKGVLHRDLKPANIMIDGKGEVRITDFGFALDTRDAAASATRTGSPAYMAPEILDGMAPTEKSDIYAMGLVLYEMCTGIYPFDADTQGEHRNARYNQTPPPPSSKVDEMDPLLERVILKCLELSPEDRPSSALAIAAALPGAADPLTIAVSIGETPSPQMVAEAGSRGVMRPAAAAWLVTLTVLFTIVVVMLSESARGLDRVDLSLPPEVLMEKAREKLKAFGWHEEPADFAYGFLENHYALSTQDPNASTASAPSAPGTSSLLFWYRQSPEVMQPAGLENLVVFSGQVGPYDPRMSVGGSALVLLHPSGTLDHLEILPKLQQGDTDLAAGDLPSRDPPSEDLPSKDLLSKDLEVAGIGVEELPTAQSQSLDLSKTASFAQLLEAAGLDPERMQSQPAIFAPPFFADTRGAFVGTSAVRPDLQLNVRTAAYRGRPTYFRMMPESSDDEDEKPSWLLSLIDEWNEWWDLLLAISTLAAIPLMRRNLRRGRGDQRSAGRLAIFVFAVTCSLWLLRGPHVADVGTEWALIRLRVGISLFQAGSVWLLYLALEPYVRRIWPHSLIAWTRLLAGRFRDPLVGSSTLYGVAIGTGWAALQQLDAVLPKWLGLSVTPRPVSALQFDYALAAGETFAGLGDHLIAGIHDAVFSLLILLLMRLVLQRPRLAAMGYVALVTALYAHEGAHPISSWLIVGLLVAVTEVYTLMRFGILTYAVAAFSSNALLYAPITLDVTAWYAGAGFTSIAVLVLLTAWACHSALRPRRARARPHSSPISSSY